MAGSQEALLEEVTFCLVLLFYCLNILSEYSLFIVLYFRYRAE